MSSLRTSFSGVLAAFVLCIAAIPASAASVDSFESGLPAGSSSEGIIVGFSAFTSGGPIGISTTASPPASVPGAGVGNKVLRLEVGTSDFAGFVHVFGNTTNTALVPRDWSSFDALTFWMHGNNTGKLMYIDVLDNRGGPSLYPFEIWTSTFNDDFSGWKHLTFEFAGLTRKDIGNGAPDDGLGLTAVHGWALGATGGTDGLQTYYVDDVQLVSSVPEPGMLAMLGTGLFIIIGASRRRRH